MKYLCLALFSVLAFASFANAQQSVYVADYTNADITGWNTINGGTVLVPYNLTSGAPVTGIGSSFLLPYQGTLSGVAGTGYDVPVLTSSSSLSFRPNDLGVTPTIGSQFDAIFSIGAPPVPGPGFSFVGSNVSQGSSGFTGSTSNTIAQLQSPLNPIDHGLTASYTWDVLVGGLGNNIIGSPRYDSQGLTFSEGSANDPANQTFIAFAPVPEPSSALLALFGSGLFLGRRRRVIA